VVFIKKERAIIILLNLCLNLFYNHNAIADEQPNIILIVADDLGYSDLGIFGSEIKTPNLDLIAKQGIQLTNYHTAPTCGPTRAMLMTGVDNHRAGLGTNSAALQRLPELRGRPGYEGYLNDAVIPFPKILNEAGYHTYMTGKWHLGKSSGKLPTDQGFDRYFGIADGGASHFSDARGTFSGQPIATYYEDGRSLEELPDDFYSSKDYTNKILNYIENKPNDGNPFFAYLAYTAPHWPLHVPEDWIDRYKGVYDSGWEEIRKTRFERQKELGILPTDTILPPINRVVRNWNNISVHQKQIELKRIELHAAMIELMDYHIGRVIDYVNKNIDRETIIIFVSDNGAEGNAINEMGDNKHWIPATFDNRIENMGKRDSYVWLGAGWAQAMVSPYKIYKSYTTQGGIKSPAIFFSTKDRFKNSKKNSVMTVMDIAPTILEMANVVYPNLTKEGILPMSGRSALNFLTNKSDSIHNNQPIGWELYGNRALIKGKYKAVLTWPPEGSGKWELFDTEKDPTESTDISKHNGDLLRELIADWSSYAEENGVAVIDKDIGYGRYP
jgi:arylsulfatase